MSRLTPYFGIMLALLIGGLAGLLWPQPTTPSPRTSLTLNPPPLTPEVASSSPESIATTTLVRETPKVQTKPQTRGADKTVASPLPVAPSFIPDPAAQQSALEDTALALRKALVNILCYASLGQGLHSISGSGVIIDPKGIILTNAHIAQYFLLKDRGVSCSIRVGSPAMNAYDASPIYLSPLWIRVNAKLLTETLPTGTGEYDFALLAITKSRTPALLPPAFPSIPLARVPVTPGTPVVIASYGAQFLEANQIQAALSPTVVFGSVKEVLTFATSTADALSLGGSAAAQEGSSGGGVADVHGNLIGTITTSTVTGSTDTRSLGAITASYIRSEYAFEMGSSLDFLLAEDLPTAVAEFAKRMPALEASLTAQLP